jgi:UDP-N-acetyl-D-glucosamine dehydrogenase
MKTLVVVGQGYVGLPIALRAVDVGYEVVGFDIDVRRVKRLVTADSYVEDITNEQLAGALASGRYRPSYDVDDCRDFDFAVITVPTPLRDGMPDLSYVEAAGRSIAKHLRRGACVVLESTTYPGTTEELLRPILEEESGLTAGPDFHLGYSPERIDPGNQRFTLVNTPKVVSGIDAASLAAVRELYDDLVEHTVPVSGTREAELVKLMENTFRHVNIALVNELAMFAGDLGINIWEALDAAATKPFGYMRFNPGPGVGGHCLPVDPSYLAWDVKRRVGTAFRFVELANDVNDHMPEYVVRRLMLALNRMGSCVNGRRILLIGLAYKPNTSDARESPALVVAERLVSLGANVRAVDPYIDPEWLDLSVPLVELSPAEVAAADAVVVLTDHACLDYGVITAHARYVLDTRHRLSGRVVEPL